MSAALIANEKTSFCSEGRATFAVNPADLVGDLMVMALALKTARLTLVRAPSPRNANVFVLVL
jgi:hypothetical protein